MSIEEIVAIILSTKTPYTFGNYISTGWISYLPSTNLRPVKEILNINGNHFDYDDNFWRYAYKVNYPPTQSDGMGFKPKN